MPAAVAKEAPPAREETELEKMIREREEKAGARDTAVEQFEAEKKRVLDEARAEAEAMRAAAKKEAEAEIARIRSRFAESPLEGLKETGIDPRRVIEDSLREEDPVYQRTKELERSLAAEKARNDEHEKRIKQWDQQTKELEEQRQHEARVAARTKAEDEVWSLTETSADKETLFQQFGRNRKAFILAAHAAADELASKGIGVTPTRVVEYMAIEARKESGQPSQVATDKANGTAPKATAQPTTLGAQDASTRRAGVKRFDDLSDAEQEADLLRVASEALKTGA